MRKIEENVVKTLMMFTSIGVGFTIADKIYDAGVSSYMKVFHGDKFNKAVSNILKKRA